MGLCCGGGQAVYCVFLQASTCQVMMWFVPILQVSELIEKFAEGNADREAPVHALKKALQLVASDCHASYARCALYADVLPYDRTRQQPMTRLWGHAEMLLL
jgi:hypothetical protein